MKMLKVFGVVVGIHIFALVLIFANPGCSSARNPTPAAPDTASPPPAAEAGTVAPESLSSSIVFAPADGNPRGGESPLTAAPLAAGADGAGGLSGGRFSPTRPGTAAAGFLQTAPLAADTTPATTHTVVRGDSLWTLAQKYKLSVAELAAANNIKPSANIRIGQKLIIPLKSTGGPAAAAFNSTAGSPADDVPAAVHPVSEAATHVVKPGETLGMIARKYHVTVGEIATANSISDPAKIRPGRELVIPGSAVQAAKTAKTSAPKPVAQEAAGKTEPAKAEPRPPAKPLFNLPAPEQDLDAGLKNAGAVPPPVIKVEDPHP